MTSAGSAYIQFEGDFTGVLRDARRYGERAGSMFGGDFGGRADKAMVGSFRGTTGGMAKDAGRAGSRAGKEFGSDFGRQAERGMGGSMKKIAGGLATAFAVVKGVQVFGDMIGEAREAARVSRITENAIRATGGAAKISAVEVGELSTALSNKAGVDDELIQTGANLLLTFKNIRNEVGKGNDVFDRAATSAVDLSVQFGSIDSASKMLGKALNDPVKGISALGRAGVTFSEDQKSAIKAMVGTNDVLGAQKIILGEVESQVGGAAAAAADPIDRLNVAWGNLLEQGGARVLPWISEMAEGLADDLPGAIATAEQWVSRLWDRGSELARGLWSQVEPAVEDVVDTLGNLRDVGEEVVEIGRPIAEGLALIGGAAVLGAISGAAQGLASFTGFLADNEGLVRLLTTALIVMAGVKTFSILAGGAETLALKFLYAKDAATGMGTSATSWGTGILSNAKLAGQGVKDMASQILVVPEATEQMTAKWSEGAGKFRAGAAGMAKSILTPQLALAALTVSIASMIEEHSSAVASAKRMVEDLRPEGFDPDSIKSMGEYNEILAKQAGKVADSDKKHDGFFNTIKGGAQLALPLMESSSYKSAKALAEVNKELDNGREAANKLIGKYTAVADEMDLFPDGIPADYEEFIDTLDNSIGQWVEEFDLDPITMSVEEMATEIDTRLKDLAVDAGYSGEQLKTAMTLSPEELKAQVEAWEELSTAVSGAWSGQLDVVSELGNQQDLTAGKVEEWYTLQTTQAQEFSKNIGLAMSQGYDPALISRLLQAGPAQAAPLLQTMVDNHKNGLVEMVNEGETAISRLSTLAVEMARLQNMAMNAQTDDMTKNLGEGMRVAELTSRWGAFATASAIAEELGIGKDKVAAIADLYGIELAEAINPILTSVGKGTISLGAAAPPGARNAERGFNTGGWVDGPMGVNRDVIPAMLTPGEVVVNKDMTNKWGASNLLALNAGRAPAGWHIPGYNSGGQVTGDLQGMHPELLRRLTMWAGAVGQRYNVGSGYRSIAEQVPLYQKYLAGRGPVAAVPGSSMHNYGLASDGNHWRSKNPGAFGLDFAVPSEAWHVQPTDARALRAGSPSTGFVPPAPLPKPPKIGPWALAQGGEGSMEKAYAAALEWSSSQMMSYAGPGMGEIAMGSTREIGQKMAAARGWTGGEWNALDRLWTRESNWQTTADNPNSSAYGIPQSLPGSKMASAGSDWRTNPATQIAWGLDYIAGRYGSPAAAWAHSEKVGWYNDGGEVLRHRRNFDQGGVLAEGWNLVNNETGAPEPLAPPGQQGPLVYVAQANEPVTADMIAMKVNRMLVGGRL